MKLSKNKIKAIRRNRNRQTPEEIADSLGIPADEVMAVLSPAAKPSMTVGTPHMLDAILRWGLTILCAVAPLVVCSGIHDPSRLPKMAFIQIGTTGMVIIWAARATLTRRVRIQRSLLALAISALLLWSAISVGYAANRIEAWFYWQHWAYCVVLFLLAIGAMKRPEDRLSLMWALTLSGAVVAGLGIAQFLLGFALIVQAAPPAATFVNRNMAAHFMVLVIPLAWGLYWHNRRAALSGLLSVLLTLMIVYVIYTRTRTAWLAVTIEGLAMTALLGWQRQPLKTTTRLRQKTGSLAVMILAIAVLANLGKGGTWKGASEIGRRAAVSPQEVTEPLTKTPEEETSVSWRIGTWRNILALIADHPVIGVGLGNLKIAYPPYHRKAVDIRTFSPTTQLEDAHNDYLQATAELGLIGAAMILFVFGSLAGTFRRAVITAGDPVDKITALAVGVAFCGIAVSAGLSFPFQRPIPPLMVMVLAGLLVGMTENTTWSLRGQVLPGLVTIAGIALLAGMMSYHHRLIKSDRQLFAMPLLNTQGKWEEMVRRAGDAYLKNADQYKLLAYAARAHIARGQYRRALDILNQLTAVFPHVTNYYFLQGIARANMGRYDAALASFRNVLNIQPDFPDIHMNMAKVYMLKHQYAKALDMYDAAAHLSPENSRIRFDMGIAATKLHRYREAAEAFEAAVELTPDWALAHKNLGIIYLQHMDKRNSGIAHLKKALALKPDIPDAGVLKNVIRQEEALDTAR